MTDDRAPLPVLPNSIDIEQALLGAILVNNDAYHVVSSYLYPRHFFEPLHQSIFKAMAVAVGRGQRVVPATLVAALGDVKMADGTPFDTRAYVARLAAEAVTIINAANFGRHILDLAAEREIIRLGQDMIEQAQPSTGAGMVAEQIEAAEAGLSKIRTMILGSTRSGAVTIAQGVGQLIDLAERVQSGQLIVPTSGLEDINKRFAGGWHPARLMVVGGRPGMGKTIFMSETLRRLATRSALSQREEEKFAAAIITLEIDVSELAARVVAGDAYDPPTRQLAYRDIMAGWPDEEESERARWIAMLRDRQRRMEKLPLYLDHAPGASMHEIAGRVRLLKERARRAGYVLGAVAIDYLGLVATSEKYRGNRVAELGENVLLCKRLAEDEEVCVILGAQLNRQVEMRDDKRPVISDLRDSGNIEEHADGIVLLYREAHYLSKDTKKIATPEGMDRLTLVQNRLSVITEKNRLGPTGTDTLFISPACSHVADADRHQH